MPIIPTDHAIRKWTSLTVLVLFTTATSIVSQRSRSVAAGERYSIATSVFLSELFKLIVGFVTAVVSHKEHVSSPSRDGASLPLFSEKSDEQDHSDTGDDQSDSPYPASRSQVSMPMMNKVRQAWDDIFCPSAWTMSVPALVYVAQNMLQLGANSHLSSVAYQGLSQLKLVTAAIISVCVFGKTLSIRQWMCLPILLGGVVFLTQKPMTMQDVAEAAALLGSSEPAADSPFSHRHSDAPASSSSWLMADAVMLAGEYADAQLFIGALLVVMACICGSFAGVYIETKLKSSMSVALSVRNAQLASFALVTSGLAVTMEAIKNGEWAPLDHFSTTAWMTVLLRGASGYVVSATLRYADAIAKGFATSVAIITTIAVESMLTLHPPSMMQVLGSSLVIISTYTYVRLGAANNP
ncbi:UDP-galactose transporter [Pseudozyma hubeiensis SY62]|uniref:UDP-galactose transporter n=1 Tax=Pseudozyma hubeiensis (strain SY62) TaxID=1305764 RepID=R9P0L9_PSEHS|nr:UDP-galactose transporter [Pseudozyma hubeiensis SY62]GAC94753.1 UDP-galactose transporter [Pseudozyma hubeiensis SY62]